MRRKSNTLASFEGYLQAKAALHPYYKHWCPARDVASTLHSLQDYMRAGSHLPAWQISQELTVRLVEQVAETLTIYM